MKKFTYSETVNICIDKVDEEDTCLGCSYKKDDAI